MKVSELGEFGLIELLSDVVAQSSIAGEAAQRQPLVGIGDDAAVWCNNSSISLATTDTLIQDVHFSLKTITWRELGHKALAVNLSDIAAMGGWPQYAMVSPALPTDTEVEWVIQLYQGMAEMAHRFDVFIVGGNVSRAPIVIINISLIGSAGDDAILTRSAALLGELVAVTGYLGSSAAGLRMLNQHLKFDADTATLLRQAHFCPQPRITEGQLLAHRGVRAAIDISDGLVSDLSQLCKASKVAARIRVDKVPIHPLVKSNFKDDCLCLALSGGEDYELLFTGSMEIIEGIRDEMTCPVTVIGEIVEGDPGHVSLIDEGGNAFGWNKKGWEHFLPIEYA